MNPTMKARFKKYKIRFLTRESFLLSCGLFLMMTSFAFGQISQRGTATSATSTSGNTISISKPTGVQTGDIMIAIITKTATSNNSTATGWTVIDGRRQSSGNRYTTVLYRIADGSE